MTVREDGQAAIWNVAQDEPLAKFAIHTGTTKVWTADWSPEGSRLLTAGDDGDARIWSTDGTPTATLPGDTPLSNARFDASGTRVITAAADGTASLWSVADQRVLLRLTSQLSPSNALKGPAPPFQGSSATTPTPP